MPAGTSGTAARSRRRGALRALEPRRRAGPLPTRASSARRRPRRRLGRPFAPFASRSSSAPAARPRPRGRGRRTTRAAARRSTRRGQSPGSSRERVARRAAAAAIDHASTATSGSSAVRHSRSTGGREKGQRRDGHQYPEPGVPAPAPRATRRGCRSRSPAPSREPTTRIAPEQQLEVVLGIRRCRRVGANRRLERSAARRSLAAASASALARSRRGSRAGSRPATPARGDPPATTRTARSAVARSRARSAPLSNPRGAARRQERRLGPAQREVVREAEQPRAPGSPGSHGRRLHRPPSAPRRTRVAAVDPAAPRADIVRQCEGAQRRARTASAASATRRRRHAAVLQRSRGDDEQRSEQQSATRTAAAASDAGRARPASSCSPSPGSAARLNDPLSGSEPCG